MKNKIIRSLSDVARTFYADLNHNGVIEIEHPDMEGYRYKFTRASACFSEN